MKFDLERCIKASQKLYIHGSANTPERKKILEGVIKSIQEDGLEALKDRYVGMKQYAGFGDQGIECEYGMGPTHGSVVFSIGRLDDSRQTELGEDEIYFLECSRDWKPFYTQDPDSSYRKIEWNLDKTIGEYLKAKSRYERIKSKFEGFEPDAH